MDVNMLVIIGLAILTVIWIMIQLALANDTINRVINLVQLPDAWQVYDEMGMKSSSVSDFPDTEFPDTKRVAG